MPDFPDVVFRIFTEDLPAYRREVIGILHEHGFPDYTFVQGNGNGPDQSRLENSLVLDVAVENYEGTVGWFGKAEPQCKEVISEFAIIQA